MELQELKTALKENASNLELQGLMKELVKVEITKEKFEEFLVTEEGKKLLQPKLDSFFSQGLATWRKNHESELEEKITQKLEEKYNPEKTEIQKEIEALRKEVRMEKEEKKRMILLNQARKNLKYSELDDILSKLVDIDEETTNSNVQKINSIVEAILQKEKLNFAKTGERSPEKSNSEYTGENPFDMKKPNWTKMAEISENNPEEAQRLKNLAGW